MKKPVYIFLFAVPFVACATVSIPEIKAGSVTCVQNSASRKVEIGYNLKNAPAIVTIDIMTNGVSIGGEHLSHLSGDVNKVVHEGGDRLITWMPNKAWPGDEVAENVTVSVTAWATNAPPDWMVVSLVDTNGYVRYYADESAIPHGLEDDLYKTEQMVFRKIPAANACYRFGSPMTEKGRSDNEAAQMVTLKEDFYLGIYEVTQRQYELIAGNRPSSFKNDSCYSCRPVENLSVTAIRGSVSWPEGGHSVAGDSFMGILGSRTGLYGFDLPTEAEWEFAARAGCGNALYNGKELTGNTTSANLDDIARYRRNGGYVAGVNNAPDGATSTLECGTAKVGSSDRNAYGLYDMLGNVWERCLDRYEAYPTVAELECGGPAGDRGSATSRTIRGGSWKNDASSIRSASRNGVSATSPFDHTGFRVWRNAAVR